MDPPVQINPGGESRAISRKAIVLAAIPLVVVVLLISWWSSTRWRYERARGSWKAATLPRLAGLSITNDEVSGELEALNGAISRGDYRNWVGDHVLLMTNGECLIYAFRHGFNNGFVNHLFLAHSSDGRWLYSSYHFC